MIEFDNMYMYVPTKHTTGTVYIKDDSLFTKVCRSV